ncbi:MAG: hypothetical protein AABZ44_09745, partial [Elusimicrobiota bacterium]
GFTGFFLDTVDVALELEDTDPEDFAGSKQALEGFVRELRKRHPHAFIIINNGLPLLQNLSDVIDAVAVEDLYTHYDFTTRRALPTQAEITTQKERLLDDFSKETGKPVLVLLYDNDIRSRLIKRSRARCRAKGYHWYATSIDLMHLGDISR